MNHLQRERALRGAYQFGPFHLDVRERRLSRGREVIPLRLKVCALEWRPASDTGCFSTTSRKHRFRDRGA
jgi:hypothetical protein